MLSPSLHHYHTICTSMYQLRTSAISYQQQEINCLINTSELFLLDININYFHAANLEQQIKTNRGYRGKDSCIPYTTSRPVIM